MEAEDFFKLSEQEQLDLLFNDNKNFSNAQIAVICLRYSKTEDEWDAPLSEKIKNELLKVAGARLGLGDRYF
jgi:hypothetical protein